MGHYVFSENINAWSIGRGLKMLGINMGYLVVERQPIYESALVPQNGDVLFFTEEKSLVKYYHYKNMHFFPRDVDIALLDNKYAMAEFLTEIGERPVPSFSLDAKIEYPIYLKARHSWWNGRKLPRGYILKSADDYDEAVLDLESKNIPLECFFYQKLLSSPISNNISTCGFYNFRSEEENIIIVTRKIMGISEKITTGNIVETSDEFNFLIERTANILKKLNYEGPFELEFFLEEADNNLYVMELNPRFWLQHSIFIDHFDNILIKRYLGLNDNQILHYKDRKIAWLDSVDFLHSIMRFRFKRVRVYLSYYIKSLSGKCYLSVAPGYFTALKMVIRKMLASVSRRISAPMEG